MNYNHKKISVLLFPLFILIALIVYSTKTFTSIGTATFLFSLSFSIIFVMLIFVKQQAFKIWLKFSIIFLPIAVILFMIAPTTGGDFFFPIDKKIVSLFFAITFLIVSILIIAIKSFQLRGK